MATEFGTLLQSVMYPLGVKNISLARALQYDVSYISKWVSGKAVPSEKNEVPVCRCIAEYIGSLPNAGDLPGRRDMDREQLASRLCEELLNACSRDRTAEQAGTVSALPLLNEETLLTEAGYLTAIGSDRCELFTAIDFFALTSESRLKLAAILDGHFTLMKKRPAVHFSMAVSMPDTEKQQDVVYDSISLIHMLTGLSHTDFSLYRDGTAASRMMLILNGEYYATAMQLGRRAQWGAFSRCNDPESSRALYQAISARLGNDTLMFRKTGLDAMLSRHDYLQSVISTRVCWLLGHLTEHVFPDDVFEELVREADEPLRAEMRRVHTLTGAVLETGQVKLMIYDSSFADLAISGEVDFFNRPAYLTVRQRVRVLEHLMHLTEKSGSVRVIQGFLSADFKYITNPCMFMSDALCYLRLENGTYEDNILMLNDLTIKQMFSRFFDTVWDHRSDVVAAEPDGVSALLEHYLQRVKMLPE